MNQRMLEHESPKYTPQELVGYILIAGITTGAVIALTTSLLEATVNFQPPNTYPEINPAGEALNTP